MNAYEEATLCLPVVKFIMNILYLGTLVEINYSSLSDAADHKADYKVSERNRKKQLFSFPFVLQSVFLLTGGAEQVQLKGYRHKS